MANTTLASKSVCIPLGMCCLLISFRNETMNGVKRSEHEAMKRDGMRIQPMRQGPHVPPKGQAIW